MQIIDVEQRSDEWHELRRGKITGSKLHGIVTLRGNSKKIGFYELMAERLGAINDDSESGMDRGERLEAEARALFQEKTGKKVQSIGFCVSDENPSIAFSPDGLIKKGKKYTESIEVKCLSSARHLEAYFEKTIPNEYLPQAYQNFIVNTDLQKLHFVFYDPRVSVLPYHTITLEREAMQGEIDFYKNYQNSVLQEIDQLVAEFF